MLVSLARQLQTWSGSILGGVGTATDMAMTLAQSRVHRPGPKAAVAPPKVEVAEAIVGDD